MWLPNGVISLHHFSVKALYDKNPTSYNNIKKALTTL